MINLLIANITSLILIFMTCGRTELAVIDIKIENQMGVIDLYVREMSS